MRVNRKVFKGEEMRARGGAEEEPGHTASCHPQAGDGPEVGPTRNVEVGKG